MSDQRVSVMLGSRVEEAPWHLLDELGRRGWRIAVTADAVPRRRLLRRSREQLTRITAERELGGSVIHLVVAGEPGQLASLVAELVALAREWERADPEQAWRRAWAHEWDREHQAH